jgi:hypothetical protein
MRRENLPVVEEVAVIIPDNWDQASRHDICLAEHGVDGMSNRIHRISPSHGLYMPSHYVLLFPNGERGWHYNLRLNDTRNSRKKNRLEQRMFYRMRIATRNGPGGFPLLLRAGRLFQKYVCDAFVTCDDSHVQWIQQHQDDIWADLYHGLQDAMLRGDVDVAELGRKLVLPSNYTGSSRWMQGLYQDSMAIQHYYGSAMWFIIFTANPDWPEINVQLLVGQTWPDRPDIVADVFCLKVQAFLADIKAGVMGPYAGHSYTIEYQKHGLPHLHILVFLEPGIQARYLQADMVDQMILAELPDLLIDPNGSLQALVGKTI